MSSKTKSYVLAFFDVSKTIEQPDSAALSQLSVRIEAFKPLLEDFNEVQFEIESLTRGDPGDPSADPTYLQFRSLFEAEYYHLLGTAQDFLANKLLLLAPLVILKLILQLAIQVYRL